MDLSLSLFPVSRTADRRPEQHTCCYFVVGTRSPLRLPESRTMTQTSRATLRERCVVAVSKRSAGHVAGAGLGSEVAMVDARTGNVADLVTEAAARTPGHLAFV